MPRKHLSSRNPPLTVAKPTAADVARLEQQFNRTGTDFLKIDVATGLTFAQTALSTDDLTKKQRNRRSARKAYDTVLRMAKKVTLQEQDAKELEYGLSKLKADLIQLGEQF